jgi:hypothetical protein
VYGNFVNLVYSFGPTSWDTTSIVPLVSFAGGGNTLSINGNNGVLYGSGRDVSLSLIGSNNNSVANGGASVIDFSFQTGGNTLSASGSNETIYGAIRDLSINLTGGSGNTADFAGMADLEGYSIVLGGNHISGGNGNNNVVYGGMHNLSLDYVGGSNNSSPDGFAGAASPDIVTTNVTSITIGANHISMSNGNNDVVFGGMENFSIVLNGGNNNNDSAWNGAVLTQAGSSKSTISIGSNNITVGNGNNDIIYGSLNNLSIQAVGGNNNPTAVLNGASEVNQTEFDLGGNIIILGNGNNDVIYGALTHLSLDFLGGNSNGGIALNGWAAYVGTIQIDGNIIHIGNGNNDVVFGSLQDFSIIGQGGNDNSVNFVGAGAPAAFGGSYLAKNNTITMGNGNNDVAYGSLQDFLNIDTGGNGNTNSGGISIFLFGTIAFGQNTITLGNGNNDVAFGDMNSFSITIGSGSNNDSGTAGGTGFPVNNISLGGNSITMGNGNNDVVFASVDVLNLLETHGTNNTNGAGFVAFTDPFGDGFNSITFANDIVTVGNGKNDTIIADDTLNPTGLNYFINAITIPGGGNTINWGNNTIIGGTGNDNYVFTMLDNIGNNGLSTNMAMQGVDILTNFNSSKGDKLSIGNVTGSANAASLDAQSAFVNIHQGGTLSGAILGVAAIFNQAGNAAASAFESAINSYIATNVPTATGTTLLQDVASYVTATVSGLASAVSAAQPPEGGIILAGHTTTDMGSFAEINSHHALTVEHTAVTVHH